MLICVVCLASSSDTFANMRYPTALAEYPDANGIWQTLKERIKYDPFNLYATIIFFFAIIHTFFSRHFNALGDKVQRAHYARLEELEMQGKLNDKVIPISFSATILHFLGEVEAIFGIWLIPLFLGMIFTSGWGSMTDYVDYLAFVDKKYTEPMFVVVVMCIASTKPIIIFTGKIINKIAKIGGSTPASWWISILCIGPLFGSFITEPAAITICALLLSKKFFIYEPSNKLKYATIGILLVSISAGGTLTHFAAPPVLMVASKWGWDTPFMILNFGWKAMVGIFIAVALYYFIFKKEFKRLNIVAQKRPSLAEKEEYVPKDIIAVHLFILGFTVFTLHHPAIVIFSFLFFIAYIMATRHYQYELNLKTPILVGFFLASLVTHGTLQAWWIEPILSSLGDFTLFVGSTILTSVNDNAAITYLGTLVPDFSATKQYMLVSGAVIGGGLTVIANAPNPAGLSILSKHFSLGVSPLLLLFGALTPTLILAVIFYIF